MTGSLFERTDRRRRHTRRIESSAQQPAYSLCGCLVSRQCACREHAPAHQSEVADRWGFPLGEAPATSWQAQWIWMPEGVDADMLLARKAFTLPEKPARAVLSITASSRYQLFINGNYICRGPARCAPHHQSFDVLDITEPLRKGKNVLAIRVHYQREDVSYYDPSRAGLLAQLDCTSGSQASTIPTDASWRVTPDESWLNASPRMARFHLEVCDRMDLRRKIAGWTDLDFDDSGWLKAQVLRRETGWPLPQPNDRPTHLIPPWTSLVARDIPYLTETASEAKAVGPCRQHSCPRWRRGLQRRQVDRGACHPPDSRAAACWVFAADSGWLKPAGRSSLRPTNRASAESLSTTWGKCKTAGPFSTWRRLPAPWSTSCLLPIFSTRACSRRSSRPLTSIASSRLGSASVGKRST